MYVSLLGRPGLWLGYIKPYLFLATLVFLNDTFAGIIPPSEVKFSVSEKVKMVGLYPGIAPEWGYYFNSPVGQTAFFENPEIICYKLIFSLMHNIAKVIYCVKNPHSIEVRD